MSAWFTHPPLHWGRAVNAMEEAPALPEPTFCPQGGPESVRPLWLRQEGLSRWKLLPALARAHGRGLLLWSPPCLSRTQLQVCLLSHVLPSARPGGAAPSAAQLSRGLGSPGRLAGTLSHALSPGLASSTPRGWVLLLPLLLSLAGAGGGQGPWPPPGSRWHLGPELCEEGVNRWQDGALGTAGSFAWPCVGSTALFPCPRFSLRRQRVDRAGSL